MHCDDHFFISISSACRRKQENVALVIYSGAKPFMISILEFIWLFVVVFFFYFDILNSLYFVCFSVKCTWVRLCLGVCVWYLTQMIIDKSPKYGCHFSLALMVIWGTVRAPPYFCLLLGTKNIFVVVPWSESSCDSTSG